VTFEYHPKPEVSLEFASYQPRAAPKPAGELCKSDQIILQEHEKYDAKIKVKEKFYDDIQV